MKFPAKYSQLPNYDYEYIEIFHNTTDGINKSEFEYMVSEIKKSSIKDKYKHRTHLENLGVIYTEVNKVHFTEVGLAIKSNKISLAEGLRYLIRNNNELLRILKELNYIGYFDGNIPKKELSKRLNDEIYRETAIATISRYIVPIINLFNISKILNYMPNNELNYASYEVTKPDINIVSYDDILECIEKAYIEISGQYGIVIAIEKIENILKTRYSINKNKLKDTWKYIYNNINLRYRYNLITLPSWGTAYKRVILNGQSFTHIIINLQ